MSADIDLWLLDHVFQPCVERLKAWTDCFGLARASLVAAVALQTAVLACDFSSTTDPLMITLAVGVTLLAYAGADGTRAMIARVERQSRPGVMNVRRVTLRMQRLAWLFVALGCSAILLPSPGLKPVCQTVANLCWLAVVYFVSCTPTPPRFRARTTSAFAFG